MKKISIITIMLAIASFGFAQSSGEPIQKTGSEKEIINKEKAVVKEPVPASVQTPAKAPAKEIKTSNIQNRAAIKAQPSNELKQAPEKKPELRSVEGKSESSSPAVTK